MSEVLAKAQKATETIQGIASSIQSTGVPGVTQLAIRNDLTPVADSLIDWTQNLVKELEAEKLAHASSRVSHEFLRIALKIYESVVEGMAFKGKEQEHQLAVRRMNDIIDAGVRAHREMGVRDTSDDSQ